MKYNRRVTGMETKKIGEHGENQARATLSGLGVEMIEEIGTPMKLIPVPVRGRKNVFQVIFGSKVSGDHRAILPGGRSVLVEVKTVWDDNLTWSHFHGEHQPEGLKRHAELGGLSLLVWVHHSGIFVMQFPIEGFRKGKGLTPEQARILHFKTCVILSHYER